MQSLHLSDIQIKLNQTIKKVSADFGDKNQFNTAIAAIMELLNAIPKAMLKSSVSNEKQADEIKLDFFSEAVNELLIFFSEKSHAESA